MSTKKRVELRLVGDQYSQGLNRRGRRKHWRELNRKTLFDQATKTRRRKAAHEIFKFLWKRPEFKSKNTPIHFELVTVS